MARIRNRYAQREFRAQRDSAGVPHVNADSWLDVLYALGYLHATDRSTQLLFGRAVATGTASWRIGSHPELFETDCFFRKMGLHQYLEHDVGRLSDRTVEQLQSYCDGVNDGLKETGRTLPMWATGFQPEPWTPASVLSIGRLLSFGGLAVSQMQNERLLVELIHAGAHDAAMRELFSPRLDKADFELLRQVKMSNQMSDDALELISDLPRLAGSNAWAVSPARSATNGALLASDPHLEVNRLPAIWYEVVMRWGDRYVMGATLPGCPLFAVSRTERLAWGVTYMKGDTVDYFIEHCRRNHNGGWQYRRGTHWIDYDVREESILRKGQDDFRLRIYENEQGALGADPEMMGDGYYLSIAWTGRSGTSEKAISAWLDLVGALDVAEAMDIVRECPQPTLCFVLADRQGHIGLQGCGQFPRRVTDDAGLTPLPAWDEKHHWRGSLPTDVLPRIYDPPEGFVATANEAINQHGMPMLVTQIVPDYRVRRIRERLSELQNGTVQEMQKLQYDLVSLQARDLLAVFLPHMPDGPMKERLANWDLRYAPESTEAALFQRLYRNVMIEMLGHDRGIGWRRMLHLCTRVGFSTMILTAADHLLKRDDSWWWHGRDKGEVIRKAAARVDPDQLITWSEVNNFHFTDRFFGTHQVGRLFGYNSRKYPMPGNHATPFQGHVCQTASREQTYAPSYHFVTDLSSDVAWTNLPGGPSESRFSKYYRSDIPRWTCGEYKKLLLDEESDQI